MIFHFATQHTFHSPFFALVWFPWSFLQPGNSTEILHPCPPVANAFLFVSICHYLAREITLLFSASCLLFWLLPSHLLLLCLFSISINFQSIIDISLSRVLVPSFSYSCSTLAISFSSVSFTFIPLFHYHHWFRFFLLFPYSISPSLPYLPFSSFSSCIIFI